MASNFLEIPFISNFLLPFVLIFFIAFAMLEKVKLFGDGKKMIHAWISVAIALIFVAAVYPKMVVGNLVLYLAVALVAIFVVILIWGFIYGDVKEGKAPGRFKLILGITAVLSFVIAIFWATGWYKDLTDFVGSNSALNQTILTNGLFILVIAAALALVLKKEAGGK